MFVEDRSSIGWRSLSMRVHFRPFPCCAIDIAAQARAAIAKMISLGFLGVQLASSGKARNQHGSSSVATALLSDGGIAQALSNKGMQAHVRHAVSNPAARCPQPDAPACLSGSRSRRHSRARRALGRSTGIPKRISQSRRARRHPASRASGDSDRAYGKLTGGINSASKVCFVHDQARGA